MSARSLFGGTFVVLGCAAAMVSLTGMIVSMQMQSGGGLLAGLTMLGAGLFLLIVGFAVLLFRR